MKTGLFYRRFRPFLSQGNTLSRECYSLVVKQTLWGKLFFSFVFLFLTTLSHPSILAGGENIVIVLSKENRVYQKILEGFSSGLQSPTETVLFSPLEGGLDLTLAQVRKKNPEVVVAVGDEAASWALKKWQNSPLVLSGVIRSMLDSTAISRARGVSLDLPAEAQLKIIREFFPQVKTVGTLYGRTHNLQSLDALMTAAKRLGIQIVAEPVDENKDFVRALQKLQNRIDAFVVLFDPVMLRPEAYQYLVSFSISNRVPLIVPAAALLKSGGTLSLEADYEGLGRQTADLVKKVRDQHFSIETEIVSEPRCWQIGLNKRVTSALGLSIPPNAMVKVDYMYE